MDRFLRASTLKAANSPASCAAALAVRPDHTGARVTALPLRPSILGCYSSSL